MLNRQIASRLVCLAVWHRAGLPVFQASGSQRGDKRHKAWQAETENRRDYQDSNKDETKTLPRNKEKQRCKQRCKQLSNTSSSKRWLHAPPSQPGSVMKHAAHISRASILFNSNAQSADAGGSGGARLCQSIGQKMLLFWRRMGQPIILPLHSAELDECSSIFCLVTFVFVRKLLAALCTLKSPSAAHRSSPRWFFTHALHSTPFVLDALVHQFRSVLDTKDGPQIIPQTVNLHERILTLQTMKQISRETLGADSTD